MLNADIYRQLGEGTISHEEVRELEALEAMLKTAAAPTAAELKQIATHGLVLGGSSVAAALLGDAAVRGASAAWDKATYRRDLNRILEVYPHLEDYPEKERRLAYSSLRHLNPHFAKDPLVGGTMLGQILRQRDPSDPSSIRFDGSIAADLVKSRVRDDDPLRRTVSDSLSRGMQSAFDQHHRDVSGAEDRKWREDQSNQDRKWREGRFSVEHGAKGQQLQDVEHAKHLHAMTQMAARKEMEWYGPEYDDVHDRPNPRHDPHSPTSAYNPTAVQEVVRVNQRDPSRAALRSHLNSMGIKYP
jgi:hypothetical protein